MKFETALLRLKTEKNSHEKDGTEKTCTSNYKDQTLTVK